MSIFHKFLDKTMRKKSAHAHDTLQSDDDHHNHHGAHAETNDPGRDPQPSYQTTTRPSSHPSTYSSGKNTMLTEDSGYQDSMHPE
ncbi:hypothetical protein BGZ73_002124, partial [Actinomortierella ambigua]